MYHPQGSDTWIQSTVLSKGGETTGKDWPYLNILHKGVDQLKDTFFDRDIDEWKLVEDEVSVALTSMASNPFHPAKRTKLENWKSIVNHSMFMKEYHMKDNLPSIFVGLSLKNLQMGRKL